ncbi:MAG: uridine kinase [Chloroflexi bacterium]|nr:uridine kinase [Chloroflexota bacterium]
MTKPVVIGIAGGSASGKTTLAERLEQALAGVRVLVIHMDHYFFKERPHMVAPITRLEYEDHNHPTSFDLVQLISDLDAAIAASEVQVIILEGLLVLQNDDLRQRLDLKLFVDAQADERIVRRTRRNMARGLGFDEITNFYLDCVRYRHQEYVEPSRWHADLVMNGSQFSELGLDIVAAWVHRQVASQPQEPA